MNDLPNGSDGRTSDKRTLWIIFGVVFAAGFPFLYAWMQTPPGSRYLGFEYNSDDHMVYAAWMRQAMSGHFFFDNRFTTASQPTLTVHLYFLVLGWVALVVGIPLASFLGRIAFSIAFLLLIDRFIKRLDVDRSLQALTVLFVALGGGLGFLCWQMFGTTFTKPSTLPVSDLLHGQLPVDVWQPEAFVFPSMLTNGLFMVSLTLMIVSYAAFLDARKSWKSVAIGFVSVGLLMNIHSYDVLTLALVLFGFLAAQVYRKDFEMVWIGRAVVIGFGALIPALWFVHVLQSDPVFQSRAATETYSPNFRALFFGYLPLFLLGFLAIYRLGQRENDPKRVTARKAGLAIFGLLNICLLGIASSGNPGYFLTPQLWGMLFAVTVAAVALVSDSNSAWNIILSWAMIGIIAIYFPGLLQRKLTMGLSVPWSILAAYGLWSSVAKLQPSTRRLCFALGMIFVLATSVLWLVRDISFINGNVANTTRHPVYLDSDLTQVVAYLNKTPGKKVLVALPGAGSPNQDQEGHSIPDSFSSPILPDTSPIVTGLTGAYSTAGHWSETPDYLTQTGKNYRFLLAAPVAGILHVMDDAERKTFEEETGANYALIPSDPHELPLVAPENLGTPVFRGKIWTLIRLK